MAWRTGDAVDSKAAEPRRDQIRLFLRFPLFQRQLRQPFNLEPELRNYDSEPLIDGQ